MALRLGIVRANEVGAWELAAQSRAALDRPLRCPAELWVATARDEALLLGAFQRGAGMPHHLGPLLARGSGGAEARIVPGTVHVLLALASPGALVACDAQRLVNRYVRPLLRALTRQGPPAHYFGRDWVSVGGRPVASVTFAHDATSGRATFEALVGMRAPVFVRDRPTFLGKEPAALDDLDPARLSDAIAEAYARDVDAEPREAADASVERPDDLHAEPPWSATCEEAIGTIGAGPDRRGVFRIGGDLLVSRDALARLEAAVPQGGDDLGRVVHEILTAPGVALDGVRSLDRIRDVVRAAQLRSSCG